MVTGPDLGQGLELAQSTNSTMCWNCFPVALVIPKSQVLLHEAKAPNVPAVTSAALAAGTFFAVRPAAFCRFPPGFFVDEAAFDEPLALRSRRSFSRYTAPFAYVRSGVVRPRPSRRMVR